MSQMIPERLILQLHNTFEHSKDAVYIKDKNFHYQYMNQAGLNSLMLAKEELLDHPDKGLHLAKYAEKYNEQDLASMQGHVYYQLDWSSDAQGNILISLAQKFPLKDEYGTVYGTLGLARLVNYQEFLHTVDLKGYIRSAAFKMNIDRKELIKSIVNLSDRETNILFFIIQGKSAKEIAKITHLSPRTVEFHTENIKKKWCCQSKNDLLSIAFNNGFTQLASIFF